MTQELDLTRLRAVAEAATPGEWTLEYDNADDWEAGIDDGDYPYALHGPRNCSFDHWTDKRLVKDDLNRVTEISEMVDGDAKFIATFDPPTVLALLSRLEQAEQQVARVRGAVGKLRKAVEDIQAEDTGLDSYSHNRSRGAGYQIASNLVDRALDAES